MGVTSFTPHPLYPRKQPLKEGWVGPGASMDILENREISYTVRIVEPIAQSLYQLHYPTSHKH
jgi:hypothetical protein